MANRFEAVDDVQPDAITLSLAKDGPRQTGMVIFPASASDGRATRDHVSGRLSALDALRAAIALANEMKVAIVVLDPQGAWNPDWGELYRDSETAE